MRTHPHRCHRDTKRRAIPALEMLEDRCVPATSVTFGAGTLSIAGDGTANIITINDAGSGAIGSVSVTADGVTTANTAAITGLTISVDTLEGADVVLYNLNGDLLGTQSRTLNANLGAQNDFFQATAREIGGLSSDLNSGSSLTLNVIGQAGRDRIFFDFGKDVDLNGTASLAINAFGGRDRDAIALTFDGLVDGNFSLNLNGGQDRDRISAYANVDGGSGGTLTGKVNGQAGDDLLAFVVNKSVTFTGTTIGTLDGGAGLDTAIASNFVGASGVENLFLLPF